MWPAGSSTVPAPYVEASRTAAPYWPLTGGAGRYQHGRMSDDEEFDDEPLLSDAEMAVVEKALFAAIRESGKLDAEIDDEYQRLVSGEYEEPGPAEDPA